MGEVRSIIQEVKTNICDECRMCTVYATDEQGNKFRIDAGFCDDGSGYISLDLYDEDGQWIENCKMKNWTDSCTLPFNLIPDPEPDCDCV